MNQDRFKFRIWNGEQMVSPDYITRDGYAHWKEDSIPNSSNKLMQCTGLKDIEGNLVYEGDLVRLMNESVHTKEEYWYPEYIITHDGWSFVLEYKGGGKSISSPEFNLKHRYQGKIIGNIYEHSTIN